ncbi:MAG: PolyA polymerase [Parcubacteria group bacterium GW2011_GWE2_39_37]|uniref:PolyA polymerase n=1 Tax=Candidatus Falkowbacteria bacterium GW2011_GWF2_39_8 TaxID=1618642 RepID=A0A0G0T1X1_9BACT|nr:MAG: PolyA polymerase [Parcubacteria group bacterium GW2011_GWE2_39_37]KKR31827.1 MAG: PolyA polymerase [Candidatus Falkowbacteria bacterium GW2011_GWF2_39_8]
MQIPAYVIEIVKKLEPAGFEAFVVGGCVRDLLLGKEPKDWDVTTNAKPEEMLKIFTDGKYENTFGTVLIPIRNEQEEVLAVVESTTYRSEQGYSDRRHPDEVIFEEELEKDLGRRDFTINAMALKLKVKSLKFIKSDENINLAEDDFEIVDLFGGQKDLKKRIIRAVGEPSDRFKEDALRMLRAIRFSCQLGFEIEDKTMRGIVKFAGGIKFVANERIKDELVKIMESERAYEGIMMLHESKLLQYILPELENGVGVKQNKHHVYTVFKHLVLSLKFCPSKDWRVRLACLLHDIAKPQTKKIISGDATFYNHDIVGAKVVNKIVTRLKFSKEDADKVVNLVRNHMFYYNVDEVTEAAVRRLLVKVGKENIKDLIDLRIGDRLGSGVPKAKPYKLRHLEYMIEKVSQDAISVKMLKINGDEMMKFLGIEPGPKIGAILDVLLSEVIENQELNNKEYLEKRSRELNELNLQELRVKAREKIEEKKMEEDEELKKDFWVK